MPPLVSIIIPVFNAEKFLEQTIHSVLEQTFTTWELILVDDQSEDNSAKIIHNYVQLYGDKIFYLKNETNSGPAITRNKGINFAKGKYIAFLDADDYWKPQKLEYQLKILEKGDADVCFSSYQLISEEGVPMGKFVEALPKLTRRKLLKSNYIGNLTGIYNAEKLGKINTYNLLKRQDWLLWLEALKRSSKPAIGIQEPLAVYRIREQSVSSNKIKLLKYNFLVYRQGLNYSTLKSIGFFMRFLWEHFFVKSKQTKSTN